jgi:hypothetical protein
MHGAWRMHRKWRVNTEYLLVTKHGGVKMGDYKFVILILVVNVGSLYHDKRRVISLPSEYLIGSRTETSPKTFKAYKICTDAVNSP